MSTTRTVLRRTTHYGSVIPDDSYLTTVKYTLSPTLSAGNYNLTVETDYRNQVFEFNRDNNNVGWKLITIMEEHPDLSIISTVELFTTITGNRLAINYTVLNTGVGPTFGSVWRDTVVIANVQNGAAIQLRSNIHSGLLLPGSNYTNQLDMNLHNGVIGNYILRVQTDVDQRIIEENDNNNIYIHRLSIPPVYADLFVFNVTSNSNFERNIVAGSELKISWLVTNIGNGLTQTYWSDAVYIDSFPSLSPSGIHLSTVSSRRLIMPEQEYQQTHNVTIPITISGDYFVFVRLDEHMQLFENGNTQNNIISFPLLVISPPSPDLVVSSVSYLPVQTESNERILTVSWTVSNIGNTMEQSSSWRDEVFLSRYATMNGSESISIGYSNIRNQALASNQEYSSSITVVLNANISGYYYIFVVTDSSSQQLELNGEYNNVERSMGAVDIIPSPLPRLRVTIDISNSSDSLTSGSSLTVHYNVTNIGERSIDLSSWTDRIYLSSHSGIDRTVIMEDGIFLGEVINNKNLEVGKTYSVSSVVSLPYRINRYVYFVVVVDVNGNLGDPALIGDMQLLHDTFSYSFLVEDGPLPDLRISPLLTSTTFRSGEPAILNFQVINSGQNIASGLWYDTVYLSRDAVLDSFDNRLISVRNNRSLDIQARYNSTVVIFIPYRLPSSEYYLFLETDVGDSQLEINENNNLANAIVTIQATASTDLVLDHVITSSTDLQYGQGKGHTQNVRTV